MPDGETIRAARADDAPDIAALVETAFAESVHGHHGEASLVRAVEEDGDSCVALVAERQGRIAGYVLFSRMDVTADGRTIDAAGLAPVAVAPRHRRQGVASRLIRAGIAKLQAQSFAMSFVVGDPHFYARFGYDAELASRFDSPFGGPYFMAMMLDSRAIWPQGGRAAYAPAFGVGDGQE